MKETNYPSNTMLSPTRYEIIESLCVILLGSRILMPHIPFSKFIHVFSPVKA